MYLHLLLSCPHGSVKYQHHPHPLLHPGHWQEGEGSSPQGGQMNRLLKAGNFLSGQQKKSRSYTCLREGPSSATHYGPHRHSRKSLQNLATRYGRSDPGSRSFHCHLQKNVIISPLCKPLPLFCMLTGFSEMADGWHSPQEEKRLSCLVCIACSVLFAQL